MTQLNLFQEQSIITSDYHEDWNPSRYSCWDCDQLDTHVPGPVSVCWCKLHDHKVCRVAGICSQFKDN